MRYGIACTAVVAGLTLAEAAAAWTITLAAATRRVWLQVGVGLYQGNLPTINTVSVTVPAGQLGSGAPQTMTSNSTQATSPFDNFVVCSPPAQVYVGASYQRSSAANGPATALMQVTSPANLVNVAGDTIPFSQISWTVSALGGDTTPNVIPAGTFAGGVQTLTTIAANRLIENCHTFAYANAQVRAAGTYNGTVTYTVSTP